MADEKDKQGPEKPAEAEPEQQRKRTPPPRRDNRPEKRVGDTPRSWHW